MKQTDHICIVTPVYNDWECLTILHREIKAEFDRMGRTFTLLAVNDGSTQPPFSFYKCDQIAEDVDLKITSVPDEILIMELHRNLGHQKAITLGISYANAVLKPDYVLVLDSDGEDKPEDISSLIEATDDNYEKIVFAHRRSRQESLLFKWLYIVYKMIFRFLSGYVISFGNFVLIPGPQLSRLVYISEIWNHFPGGIIRSKLKYTSVPIDRGSRYGGKSKMSLIALIQHGISSITVNIDIVSVRLLVFSVCLIILTGVMFCGLIWVKFFSSYAIPGWTSSIAIGLLMIMLQAFFFSLLLTFMVLNARVQRNFIPALNFRDYIRSVNKCGIHV